ncbi:glycosyltransferase family 4 protein [Runella sp.]|uniref:glycosyltransferase family 4 protein n=1 Tax=Runella sp. TaxID=1960881 RepID=UPI003D108864
MKLIISQGLTKIHLIETSIALKRQGEVKIKYLTGWVPRYIPAKVVNFIGNMVGRPQLSKRLLVRTPKELSSNEIITNALPEFLYWGLLPFRHISFFFKDQLESFCWRFWGYCTINHLTDADIFHVRSGAGQGGAIQKAKKNGIKVIVDHSIAHPKAIRLSLQQEYKKFNKKALVSENHQFWKLVLKDCQEADYVLVNSDYVKETFLLENFPSSKIKVIYWGVRKDFFKLKKDYTIKDKIIKLLFTGTFDLRKGAATLVDALNILTSRGLIFLLDVVGPYAEEATSVLKNLRHPKNVILHGALLQDDIKSFLTNADIYVFPTFAEGSARSAMEAMAAGLPVITTNNCGVPIIDGDNGLLIPIDAPEILANKIESLALDSHLREKLGTNAAKTIQDNYTWEHYAKNLKQFYQEVINEKIL